MNPTETTRIHENIHNYIKTRVKGKNLKITGRHVAIMQNIQIYPRLEIKRKTKFISNHEDDVQIKTTTKWFSSMVINTI